MRRLALLGLLAALPLVVVPLVWAAATGGGPRERACLVETRDAPRWATAGCLRPEVQPVPVRRVASVRATPRRIEATVVASAGVSVEVRDASGTVVRRLGHFTVPARQRLVFTWDGRDDAGQPLPAGRYVAVVSASGARVAARFAIAR
jgi:FlgD Ig-like domain